MIVQTKPLAEVTPTAIRVLCKEIGLVDTMRFVGQFTVGSGNYAEENNTLFADMTPDDMITEIQRKRTHLADAEILAQVQAICAKLGYPRTDLASALVWMILGWRGALSVRHRFTLGLLLAAAGRRSEDELSLTGDDPDHSSVRARLITFGVSRPGRLLAVSHMERGERIRIISARPATRAGRRLYEEG